MENRLEDKFICGRRFGCQEWACSEDVCLAYGDCIWCENKVDPEICKMCNYGEKKRYE